MHFLLLLFLGLLQLVSAARSGTYYAGWPVGDSTWKTTDTVFQRETGISRYRLFQADGLIYKYQLDFEVTERQGEYASTYVFFDSEGDEYYKMVFVTGTHTLNFNSGDPYIQQVKVIED
ncbi:uncharacterized protein BO87DRAFT_371120 [Aspergillus neoniger CBS 115656]|uniref:Uncharacterized protein n=1 Tax=Aspergillus neoniger (strain CBS 115656) TaxID=1448310 RepID=A0A318Y6K7_ASPNB|nr:hypothetical protein BO87DRAFT_371120 [Aspergillus neoniger CBS 115656]PYH28380.1 hypothetical protein BO87DRAFT_371120 [Aspergillus neoniger CBS 115656]